MRGRIGAIGAIVVPALLVAVACTSSAGRDDPASDTTVPDATTSVAAAAVTSTRPPPPGQVAVARPLLDIVVTAVDDVVAAGTAVEADVVAASEDPAELTGLTCAGQASIAVMLVPVGTDPASACERRDAIVRLDIATNVLVIATSSANPTDCITPGDLYALAGPEAAGRIRWSDANEAALDVGGFGGWPREDLVIVGISSQDPIYDTSIRLVFEPIAAARGEEPTTRPDYSTAGGEYLAVVAANDWSIGWFAHPFAAGYDGVKLLAVAPDAGANCVEPSPETAVDGTYPLAETVTVLVDMDRVADDPELVAVVDALLGDATAARLAEADHLPLDRRAADLTHRRWRELSDD